MTPLRSTALVVPLALLAACHGSNPKNDQRSAQGEVLKGTTSDAMLPLGQLTSQPPLLPPTNKGPKTPEQAADAGSADTGTTEATSAEPGAAAAPVPAPSAAP